MPPNKSSGSTLLEFTASRDLSARSIWPMKEKLLTEAGATVHVQPRAKVALAVVGPPGVDTRVLAAPVMDLALVDICGVVLGWGERGGAG